MCSPTAGEPILKHETVRDRPIHAAVIIIFAVVIPLVVFTYIAIIGMAIACFEYRMRVVYAVENIAPSPQQKLMTTSVNNPPR